METQNGTLELDDGVSSDGDSSDSSNSDEARDICTEDGVKILNATEFDIVTHISPLDVRFSQPKMKHLFGDGRRVADAVKGISLQRCTPDEAAQHDATWRLVAPFPTIEIIRWHCKLRDEHTGKAKVDAQTGEELYDQEERWFTLDNRRLYCLQQVAARVLPETCIADVVEIRLGLHSRTRGLRKFRTLDLGKSIKVGSRADNVPFIQWSWEDNNGLVYDYIKTLKSGNHEVIESSKKLSGILRRTGQCSRDVRFDEDGWVKVSDLLQLGDFLDCRDATQFFAVVKASNEQKLRYELWPESWESKDTQKRPDSIFIRACSRVAKDRLRAQRAKERQLTSTSESAANQGAAKSKKKGSKKGGKPEPVSAKTRTQELPLEALPKALRVAKENSQARDYIVAALASSDDGLDGTVKQSPEEKLFAAVKASSSSSQVTTVENTEEAASVKEEKLQVSEKKKAKAKAQKAAVAASSRPTSTVTSGKYPASTPQQAQLQKAYQMQAMFHMHTMMCAQQQLMMIQQAQQMGRMAALRDLQTKFLETPSALQEAEANWQPEEVAEANWEPEEVPVSGWEEFQEEQSVATTAPEGVDMESASAAESKMEDSIEAQIAKAVAAARERNPDNIIQAKIKKVMQAAQERNDPSVGSSPEKNGSPGKAKNKDQPAPSGSIEDEIARVMASARERTSNRFMESI